MFRKQPPEPLMQRHPGDASAVAPVRSLQTVVVGVDFSPASLRAARWVGTQLAPNATLLLAHVVAQPMLPVYVRTTERPMPRRLAHDADGLTGGLHGLAETLGAHRTRIVIRTGNTAHSLAQVAEDAGADLICIGRGPRPRDSARFGGTTPLRLLAWSRVPTLVVPMIDLGPPGPIVVGLDDRPDGQHVLEVAGTLAARLDASVDAMHVIEPEFRQFVESSAGTGTRGGTHDGSWLDGRAQRWAERCVGLTGRAGRSTAVVANGDPGQEIIRHARRRRAGLIVVGQGGPAHTAGIPPGSLATGSSTRLLIWASPCPVLVVPLAVSPAASAEVALAHTHAPRRRARATARDGARAFAHSYLPHRGDGAGAPQPHTLPNWKLHVDSN